MKSLDIKLKAWRGIYGRKVPFLLFLWALCCWCSVPANAALQFDVFPGYGEKMRAYHWCPFTFEMHQDGPDFNGFISLRDTNTGVEHTLPIELPTNTRKRVVIPVYYRGGGNLYNWIARLVDTKGRTVEERSQFQGTEIPWSGYMMGSISRSFSGQPELPKEPQQEQYQPRVGRIQASHFPDQPLALEGLNSIYLHASQALELEIPQAKALSAWLAQGGHLVVAMDEPAEVNGVKWLSALIPFIPNGVASLEWDGTLEKWLRDPSENTSPSPTCDPSLIDRPNHSRHGQNPNLNNRYTRLKDDKEVLGKALPVVTGVLTDGRVLAEQDDRPLIIHASRGRGQLTLLTFNPEREPVKAWENKAWFWAKLGGIPGQWFEGGNRNFWSGNSVDGLFGSMIESRQVKKLPVEWLMIMLVVYLIFIGPFDRIVLRKLNREMWTWVTFPAYVILFSALIYYVGFRLRAGDSEWSELHVVDVIPFGQETLTRGRTYGSLYSPVNADYQLTSKRSLGSFRTESTANWNGSIGGQSSKIMKLGEGFVAGVSVPVWTSKLFISDWYDQLNSAPIEAKIELSNKEPTAIVLKNETAHEFKQVRLIWIDRVFELEGLPGGPTASQSFQLSDSISTPLDQFLRNQSSMFTQALQSRSRALGHTFRLDDVFGASTTASFVDKLYKSGINSQNFNHQRNIDLTTFLEQGNAVLLAWTESDMGIPKMNEFTPNRESRNTLLRLLIPVTDSSE